MEDASIPNFVVHTEQLVRQRDPDEMFGVSGASDEIEALACAIWAHRCPGLLLDEDDDRPHYMAAAKAAFDVLDGLA